MTWEGPADEPFLRSYDEVMQVLDALALVGEMLSWIGLGIGVPVLLLAALIRLVEGQW